MAVTIVAAAYQPIPTPSSKPNSKVKFSLKVCRLLHMKWHVALTESCTVLRRGNAARKSYSDDHQLNTVHY